MSHILIVDDDAKILSLTGAILKNNGYDVVTTRLPEEAIKFFKAEPEKFSLILLDWKLKAALDGDVVMQVIHHMFPSKKVPVIFVTAHTNISSKYLMRLGAFDTLSKPFTSTQLLDAVERVFGKKPEDDPHKYSAPFESPREFKKQELARKIMAAITSSRSLKEAADHLNCSRMTLYRWLEKTGLSSFVIEKDV